MSQTIHCPTCGMVHVRLFRQAPSQPTGGLSVLRFGCASLLGAFGIAGGLIWLLTI